MGKSTSEYAFFAGLLLAALACSLPLAPSTATPKISGGGEEFIEETAAAGTALPMPGKTDDTSSDSSGTGQIKQTPTFVPADQCPPFALDTEIPPPNNPQGFIGKHYDVLSLPAGLKFKAGMMLDDYHSWTRFLYSGQKLEWLERLICWDAGGVPYFTIIDAIILPRFTDDQTEAGLCWLNGEELHAIIAVGHVDVSGPVGSFHDMEGWKFDRLDYGYRIDLILEKFLALSMEGLECIWPNSSLEGG